MAAITASQPLECLMGPPHFSLHFQVLTASSPLWLLPLTHPSTRVVTVQVLLAICSQLLSNVLSSKQILCSAGSLQFRCSKTVPHFAAVLGNQRASTKVLGWLTCSRLRSCPFPRVSKRCCYRPFTMWQFKVRKEGEGNGGTSGKWGIA